MVLCAEGVARYMTSSLVSDPYYQTEVAQWVMKRVTGTGIGVDVLDDLEVPACSSRAERHIWLRAGLSFQAYHWAMARSIVHQLFGVEPDGSVALPDPVAQNVSNGALVIPFQRPPFSSGTWRH